MSGLSQIAALTASLTFICDFFVEPSILVYVLIAFLILVLSFVFTEKPGVTSHAIKKRELKTDAMQKGSCVTSCGQVTDRPISTLLGHHVLGDAHKESACCESHLREEFSYIGTVKSCSVQHGYGFFVCDKFDKDIIFFMSELQDADPFLVRPGKVATFKVYQHNSGPRAEAIRFTLEGYLKSFDAVRNHGFIRCPGSSDVWFGRSDVVTVDPLMSAGTEVQFELYYGGNGKPRARRVDVVKRANGMENEAQPTVAEGEVYSGRVKSFKENFCFVASGAVSGDIFLPREEIPDQWEHLQVGVPVRFNVSLGFQKPRAHNVKMVVMTFRKAYIKSYNAASHYGFLCCDGLHDDVWFAEAAVVWANAPEGSQRQLSPGSAVQVEIFQRGDGQLRAFRVVPLGTTTED